jgi:cysteine desulfurase family protein (TIGR01976 family)
VSETDLSIVRGRFPALSRTQDGQPVVFADSPGGSQVPDTVIEAVADHFRGGVSNSGGAFAASEETDELVLSARRAGADLVGARPDQIVFGANATTLLLHLSRSFARTLSEGDTLVLTRLDHDANVRPWVLAARDAGARIRWVDIDPSDTTLDLASFDEALAERPRLVAFTLASNGTGTVTPAAALIPRAKAAGALVAVDGVHLAQHRAIDFERLGADVLAVSPYKIFGPHMGMVAATREVLDGWDPYRVRPAETYPSPERWETGTQNHEGMAGFVAAVDYLAGVGTTFGAPAGTARRDAVVAAFDAIRAHERGLATRFLEGIARIDAVRLYGVPGIDRLDERTPTFAVRLGDQDPRETSKRLAERGIYTWDGHYYAMELFERLGILDSGGAVRIGFCHYHSPDEVDRVVEALSELSR